jgi:hypothetical protein
LVQAHAKKVAELSEMRDKRRQALQAELRKLQESIQAT